MSVQNTTVTTAAGVRRPGLAAYFTIIVAAVGLWLCGVWLSEHLVSVGQREMLKKELERNKKQQESGQAPEFVSLEKLDLPPEVAKMRSLAKENPADDSAQLNLAQHLVALGNQRRDPAFLMHGLGAYQAALRSNPKNTGALRGLADLCAEQGLFPEAAATYGALLEIEPGDIKVRTDYALVLIQSGKAEDGIKNLDIIIKQHPDNFPARLAKALGYRVLGDFKSAKTETQAALKVAPDDTARGVAQNFADQIDAAEKEGPKPESGAPAQASAEDLFPPGASPATVVDALFRNHPIIGPKIDSITWNGPNEVKISLNDFPIEAMPPVAKEKLTSRTVQALSSLNERITVKLVDAASGRDLLELSGGGADAPKKP